MTCGCWIQVMPLLARFMDFKAVATARSAGEVAWLSGGLSSLSTVAARTHDQHRFPEWSSSSLPHPMQSMLSWTPEQLRHAGSVSTRPGRTPSWPQAQMPRVRLAAW